jgi:hypothetical protein
VEFRRKKGVWARCLTEEYVDAGYDPRDGQSKSKTSTATSGKRRVSWGPADSTQDNIPGDPDNKNKLHKGDL